MFFCDRLKMELDSFFERELNMFTCAEDKAISELARSVLLLIELLEKKELNEKERSVLKEAKFFAQSSLETVT